MNHYIFPNYKTSIIFIQFVSEASFSVNNMYHALCQPLRIKCHRPCHPRTICNSRREIWWAKNPLEMLGKQCVQPLLRQWNNNNNIWFLCSTY